MALTFSQAQGLSPLPSQADLGTISKGTSAALWRIVHDAIQGCGRSRSGLNGTWMGAVLHDWWVEVVEAMIDEAPYYPSDWIEKVRKVFDLGFPHSYDFVQFMLQHRGCDVSRKRQIADALEKTHAAYRAKENMLVPFISEQQFEQFETALAKAGEAGASGSKAHLLNAGKELTAGHWARSIHESISAVESAARVKSGAHGKGLSDILAKMKRDGAFTHPALADALTKLYAYSSDEKGIRHSLVLNGEANANEAEAMLLYGLCASFVTYVLSLPQG